MEKYNEKFTPSTHRVKLWPHKHSGLCINQCSGYLSGTLHGTNSGCTDSTHDGPWSSPVNIQVDDTNNITSLSVINGKTNESVVYDFSQVSIIGDDTTASLSGPVITTFSDSSTGQAPITGTIGTNYFNTNFSSPTGDTSNCSTSLQAALIKTA